MVGNNFCYECQEVITEPICVDCFKKEITIWIEEQKINPTIKARFNNLITNALKKIEALPLADTYCILCSKQINQLCIYCTMKEASNLIKDKISKDHLVEFFNYELQHFGLQRSGEMKLNEKSYCSCGKKINTPLCNECRTKELEKFLQDQNLNPIIISKTINGVKNTLDNYEENFKLTCINCDKNLVSNCINCYATAIQRTLFLYLPESLIDKVLWQLLNEMPQKIKLRS